MPKKQSKEPFLKPEERLCDIEITLVRFSGVEMSYNPMTGVKRQMWFDGHVEQDARDDRFKGKPVRIRVESPPDPELEKEIKIAEKVDGACGWFGVRANVEPRDFEKEIGEPPIQASITVSPEAFDAVSAHTTKTLNRLGRVRAKIMLVGKSLPKTGSGLSVLPILLTDLDVSKDKNYAVQRFEIAGTRTLYPRKRVLPIERGLDDRGGATLSILLTEAAYYLAVPTGRVHLGRCYGSVINAKGKSYEGAQAKVTLEEFHMWRGNLVYDPWRLELFPFSRELDPADKLPERSLFGNFSYWPKNHDKEYSSDASFDLKLAYLPEDTRGLIIPVLSQVNAGQVILTVELTNDEEDLLGATDVVEGSVRNYGFRVKSRSNNQSS